MDIIIILEKFKSGVFFTALSAAFLLSSTLFFFGPATLYYSNFFEFSYSFSDIWPYLIILTLISIISLTFLLLQLNKKTHDKIICIVFALGLLFYIQGNIIVWDYGLLDGHEIIWNNYLIYGIIDSIIWIAILAISFFKSEKIFKFVSIACVFLIFIQTAGFFALVQFAPSEPQWKSYSFYFNESSNNFSENENVIIFVLDTFQSDLFQEIINENDEYKKMFNGFTYYRNSASGYQSTITSVPLILTGEYYNNSKPFASFIQDIYPTSSLPKTLKDNGYIIEIFGDQRLISPDETIISNVQKNSYNAFDLITHLSQISLFRQTPHFFKQLSYNLLIKPFYYPEYYSDVGIYTQFKEHNLVLTKSPVFKYYHLNGAHPPFLLNESLGYMDLPNNRSGYKEQAKASLKITNELIQNLKKSGIYDNSIIFIIGDHGMQHNTYGINVSQLPMKAPISYTSENYVSSGIPLILMKTLNSNETFAVSDAPVSLSDIPKTVLTELNLPNKFPGESILKVNDSEIRERKFYYIENIAREDWYQLYLPPMTEYRITNFSWFGGSWEPTYNLYTSEGIKMISRPDYNFGTTIIFGKNQKSTNYLMSGWGYPDEKSVWSDGNTATLAFMMNRSDSDMCFQFLSIPFIVEHIHEKQNVTIYFNRHEIGNILFSHKQSTKTVLLIPNEYCNEGMQYITFSFQDPISPSDLGISADIRKLGIAISSFTITKVDNSQSLCV